MWIDPCEPVAFSATHINNALLELFSCCVDWLGRCSRKHNAHSGILVAFLFSAQCIAKQTIQFDEKLILFIFIETVKSKQFFEDLFGDNNLSPIDNCETSSNDFCRNALFSFECETFLHSNSNMADQFAHFTYTYRSLYFHSAMMLFPLCKMPIIALFLHSEWE